MTRRRKWIVAVVVVVPTVVTIALVLFSHKRPELGLVNGRLRSCPDTPNGVCSFDTDEEHGIAPLKAGDDPQETMQRLRSLIDTLPRTNIVTDTGGYMHVEFTTRLLRFVDDVEFLLDEEASLIHVRSASRVGRSDLGANRERVEMIRQQMAAEDK